MGEIKKGEVEIMKFKRIAAIVLSVTTLLSNVTQTSFADEISEAEQDKNESIRQDSIANQTTAPNETTSLNQEYVTNRSSGTTEAEDIGQNINKNEVPEKNKVKTMIPLNFTAEFEKLEKNSKGGYLDYIKATRLAVNSIESGAKDHVILEDMGPYGDKNYYWFSYKALDRVLPNIKRKYFDSKSAKPIINKIENFISQNGPNRTEEKVKKLVSQNVFLKQDNLVLARSLFASIGAAAGYALCSLFNFVKNKCTATRASSDNAKEQNSEKSRTKYNEKKQKVAKDNAKKSSRFFKPIITALGALAGLIIYPWVIRKNAENKVNNDKKAEFESLYKELFDNDLKNADCYDMLAKILNSVDGPINIDSLNNNYHYPAYFQGNKHSCIEIKFDGPSRAVSFQGNPIKLDSIEKDAINQNFDRLVKEIKQFQANNSLNKKNSWEKSLGVN